MNEVAVWLASLGLDRYADAFAAQDIGLDVLPELSDADLKEIGVASLGDRKRLLKAVAALGTAPAAPSAAQATPSAVPETPSAAPAMASAVPATSSAAAAPQPAPAPRAPEAERRQLTVMFCDMVGSTALSARLDPEDLQGVIRSFHAAVATAVAQYDGHVAQYLGDGVLVYFGYPRAHEDDAARALRAALATLAAIERLRPLDDIALQTRIGIATGRVVVGEIGTGTSAAEQSASGETPNLAARLQAQARPGEIVVSDATRRLARASFEMRSLGVLTLKGFASPVQAWRVVGERRAASRFEAEHDASELVRFIGRDSEVALLLERWALACDGEGQVVLLSGEAGIGKSRITHTLRERIAGQSAATVLLQCSPYFSRSALYPLVQYFERVARIAPDDDAETRTAKLARLTGGDTEFPALQFGHLLRLMGLPDGGRVPDDAESPQARSAAMLQAPIDLLRGLSREHPVLLLIEDAHWIDPTTGELTAMTIEQLRDARVLIVITCRPEYAPSWGHPAHLTQLTLSRLGQRQCGALIDAVTGGKPLPPEVQAEIVRKTDGVPLFVEELTRTVVQSGLLEETETGFVLNGALPALAIPSTLQDSLMARLDRLAPAKEVAQVSALIGREFSRRLLAAVLRMPDAQLDAALDDLVRAELVTRREPGPHASYSFRHALIRDTASASLLKSQRVLRHAQIAAAIERIEPDTMSAQPELLAHHYQEGGQPEVAFGWWLKAGDSAAARLANREATAHWSAALALLPQLDAARHGADEELDLQMKLGLLLMQTDGYAAPQTARCFVRSRELAVALGKVELLVVACAAIGATLWAAGRYRDAIELQRQLSDADMARLPAMIRVFRTVIIGLAELHLGEFAASWSHTEQAMRDLQLVEPEQRKDIGGIDPAVMILSQQIGSRVPQGFLEQADALAREAMAIAQRRGHEPTRAWALALVRWMAYLRGDAATSERIARETLAISERLGFRARIATGHFMLGRALVPAGQVDEGARLLRDGFAKWLQSGARCTGTELAAQAASVLIDASRLADAAEFVLAGERLQREIEERYYAAELVRLRARLLELGAPIAPLEGDGAGDPEALYRRAIELAERQGAWLLALRAATDLARRLRSRGRERDADAVLRPIYARFGEGFDEPDLLRARAQLAAAVPAA